MDSNIDQERKDKTHKIENFEEGDFPALRPTIDRPATLMTTTLPVFVELILRKT